MMTLNQDGTVKSCAHTSFVWNTEKKRIECEFCGAYPKDGKWIKPDKCQNTTT